MVVRLPAAQYRFDVEDMEFTPENFGDVNVNGENVVPAPLEEMKFTPENFGASELIDVKFTLPDAADVKPTVVCLTGVDCTGAKVGDMKPVPDELPAEGVAAGVLYVAAVVVEVTEAVAEVARVVVGVVEVVLWTVDDPGMKLITTASLGSEGDAAALFGLGFLLALMEPSVMEPSVG